MLQNGDTVRIDLNTCTANMLVSMDVLAQRARQLESDGYPYPESQTPWQQYFREKVGRFDEGMILKDADHYQDISRRFMPRDNH